MGVLPGADGGQPPGTSDVFQETQLAGWAPTLPAFATRNSLYWSIVTSVESTQKPSAPTIAGPWPPASAHGLRAPSGGSASDASTPAEPPPKPSNDSTREQAAAVDASDTSDTRAVAGVRRQARRIRPDYHPLPRS